MATLQGLAPPDAGVQILHVPESEAEAETEPLPKVAARPALKRPNPGASETSADRARGESPAAPALPKTEAVQVGAARAPPRRVPTGEHFPSVMVADDAEERDKNAATETRAKSAAEPKSAAVAFVLRPLADSVAEIPKAAADLKSTPSSVPPPSGSPSRWVVVVLALIALVAVLLFVLR
ncbi:MAG TPA: hypothetical protein PKD61_05300 [Polyangiaceae bacterium]|nr:hypothetical protein [Polyangiaceae bacterium]